MRAQVSEANEQNVCTLDWEECPSLRGQHASEKSTGRRLFGRPQRDLWCPPLIQHEAQSK